MNAGSQRAATALVGLLDAGFALLRVERGRWCLQKKGERVVLVDLAQVTGDPLRVEPELQVVGLALFGDETDRSALQLEAQRQPRIAAAVYVYADGTPEPADLDRFAWQAALRDALDAPPVTREVLVERLTAAARVAEHAHTQQAEFRRRLLSRPPRVTPALLAVVAAFFVAELALGALDDTAVLLAMGALVRPGTLPDEPWRLCSSVFLHGSVLHVGMNGFVLFVLGRSLERILGPWRMLLIFCASGIAGGLASLWLLPAGVSVGASGAIWGLLGAEASLAFGATGVIPDHVVPALKKAAITNLLINVGISFTPHIDWAAHFGGGAAGALLVFSRVALAGQPRLDDPDAQDRLPVGVRAAAVALAALLLGGALYGPWAGRPWALGEAPELVPETIEGLAVLRPAGMPARRPDEAVPDTLTQRLFGDLDRRGVLVELSSGPYDARLDDAALARTAEELRRLVSTAPPNAERLGPVRTSSVGDEIHLRVEYGVQDRMRVERYVRLSRRRLDRVDVYASPKRMADGWAGVAARMARSVRSSTAAGAR